MGWKKKKIKTHKFPALTFLSYKPAHSPHKMSTSGNKTLYVFIILGHIKALSLSQDSGVQDSLRLFNQGNQLRLVER